MKLVVIYGAPGVGKLTTALALGNLTGFRVFHNHLSFNLVRAIFDFPSPPFLDLMQTIRLATFEAAARERLPGLVFTFVYANPGDDAFVRRMTETVERHGGEVLFARLTCDAASHERRVMAGERQGLGKITSVDWVFGDGGTALAAPGNISPAHPYGSANTFTVFGTATITGVTGTVTGSTTTTILP